MRAVSHVPLSHDPDGPELAPFLSFAEHVVCRWALTLHLIPQSGIPPPNCLPQPIPLLRAPTKPTVLPLSLVIFPMPSCLGVKTFCAAKGHSRPSVFWASLVHREMPLLLCAWSGSASVLWSNTTCHLPYLLRASHGLYTSWQEFSESLPMLGVW